MLTHFRVTDHFAVWGVPDGQLLAVNRGVPDGVDRYWSADFGVPGSASEGLLGFGVHGAVSINLWDVSPQPGGGLILPRLRSRAVLAPGGDGNSEDDVDGFSFSPDGSKFATVCCDAVHVYDVASLTRLGAYTVTTPTTFWTKAAWAPDGRHVLVSWRESASVWDFGLPEAPSVVTIDVGPNTCLHSWSPSGASYFVIREQERRAPNGPRTYGSTLYALVVRVFSRGRPAEGAGPTARAFSLEERRAADGSLVRAINLGACEPDKLSFVLMSPDARALVLRPSWLVAPRVLVFDQT